MRNPLILGTCLAAMTVIVTPLAGQEKNAIPPHTEKVLRVPMVDTPPIIDGQPDEIWKLAPVADGFSLYQGTGWPTQKTEVRVLYDPENLYLFATLHESQPDKIVTATLDQRIDNLVCVDDCLEIFIQPAEGRYFHLMVNAANVKYDRGHPCGGLAWNPEWKHATRLDRDAWFLEAAIPLAELTYPGCGYAGTPAPGTEWRVNFCREEQPSREWSNWSCTYSGFHQSANFGHLIFSGAPDRPSTGIISVNEGDQFFGRNNATVVIGNPNGGPKTCSVEMTVVHDHGQPGIERRDLTIPANGRESVSLPYEVTAGGDYRVSLSLLSPNQAPPVVRGAFSFSLPHYEALIPEYAEQIGQAVRDLSELPPSVPGAADLKKTLREQADVARTLAEDVARGTRLPPAQWRTAVESFRKLSAETQPLMVKARLLKIYAGLAAQIGTPSFFLTTASSLDKVFRTPVLTDTPRTAVNLSAARNEYESFQIVVAPFSAGLSNVTVWPGDLRTDDGRNWINSRHISFRIVDYVYRDRPWYWKEDAWPEWFPDILWSRTLFDVKEGTQQPVWITIHTPADAVPGTYRGRIAVQPAGGPPQHVDVTLRVRNFAIPGKSSLRTDPWFSVWTLQRFYNPGQPIPVEMETAYHEFLSRYRLSSFGQGGGGRWANGLIKCYVDKNEDYTFDFSGLLPVFRSTFSRGTNAFNPNLGCNAELFGQVKNLTQAISRETGQPVTLTPAPADDDQGLTMKRIVQFWNQYTAWLRRNGWLEAAQWEYFDEPHTDVQFAQLRAIHTRMREIAPGMKIFSLGLYPDEKGKAFEPYVDCWGPQLHQFSGRREAFLKEQAKGRRFWVYACEGSYNNDGEIQHSPDIGVIDPGLERRIIPWFCFKWNIDGFTLFMLNAWGAFDPDFKPSADPAQRWPLNGRKRISDTWEDYQLIYPAPDGRPAASIRLENLRDGLEDYEYLIRLRQEVGRLKKTKSRGSLTKEAESLLNLEPEIAVHCNHLWQGGGSFVKDPAVLQRRRDAIGDMIDRLSLRATAKQSHGLPRRQGRSSQ